MGHQARRQDAHRDSSVDLGLAKMAHRLGQVVAAWSPVALDVLPDRAVEQQEGGYPPRTAAPCHHWIDVGLGNESTGAEWSDWAASAAGQVSVRTKRHDSPTERTREGRSAAIGMAFLTMMRVWQIPSAYYLRACRSRGTNLLRLCR